MRIHRHQQYSLEWWKARAGLPSASRAGEIITPTGRKSSSQTKYMASLITTELGLDEDEDDIQTGHMARGLELEEDGRLWFELNNDIEVHQVGLVVNDAGTACCSPDGILEPFTNRGNQESFKSGWECKVPMAKTHIEYCLEDRLPPIYRPQVHMSMVVSDVRHWVFQSYHPELAPLIVEVDWDEYTDKLKEELDDFIMRLAAAKEKIDV
jgi:hypothetical protein